MSAPTYTPSKAQVGRGSSFMIGPQSGTVTGTETYVHVGEVISIDFGGGKRSIIKTTSLDSGEYDSKLSTQIDAGTVTLEMNRIATDAGQLAMSAAFNSAGGFPYDFKVQLPLNPLAVPAQTTIGDVLTFSAVITDYNGYSVAVDKAINSKVTLEISGPLTVTPGS